MSIRTRLAAVEGHLIPEHEGLGYPHLNPAELEAEAERLGAEGRTIILAPDAPPGLPQIIEICDGGLLPDH